MRSEKQIRVATLIGSRLECDGMDSLLRRRKRLLSVGAVTSIGRFVELCKVHSPEVGIVDATIPFAQGDVFDSASKLANRRLIQYALFLDDYANQLRIRRALAVRRAGYMTRDVGIETLIKAISELVAGRRPIVWGNISFRAKANYRGRRLRIDRPALEKLTPREYEVFQLLAEGRSLGECAAVLKIAKSTVDNHKERIKKKLNLRKLTQLMRLAIREGLVAP